MVFGGSLCSCGHGAGGNACGKALTELFREINEGFMQRSEEHFELLIAVHT